MKTILRIAGLAMMMSFAAASVAQADMDCQNEPLAGGTYTVCKADDGTMVCSKDGKSVNCPPGAW